MKPQVETKSLKVSDALIKWGQQRNFKVNFKPEVTSTNDWAKEQINEEVIGSSQVFVCGHQTQGRGRGQNIWKDSGQDSQLLTSWCFSISEAPQPILSARIGLGLFTALSSTWSTLDWGLKPPNDIELKTRKVAGLLIEVIEVQNKWQLIVGLGMNVYQKPDIFEATSISSQVSHLDEVDSVSLFSFFSRWKTELELCIGSPSARLSMTETKSFIRAINNCGLYKNRVTSVSETGDIHLRDGNVVSWRSL